MSNSLPRGFLTAALIGLTCTAYSQTPNGPATTQSQSSPGILQAVEAAQEAKWRALDANNLKQISLAAMQYEISKKSLPGATLIGKDGKTRHSWRVALLPYIEQMALYQEYHSDEPWDSENNRKLIEKMPSLYRSPFADPKSTDASYFMLSGKGTIGDGDGTKMAQIKDGTSNTIMFVEANRTIPWTKPEDIEIDSDPTKPLPKFGFSRPGGEFAVAFADGSVRRVVESVDRKLLRALFTTSGGESIPNDQLFQSVIGKKDPE